jgi:hypothetical protein
VNSHLWELAPSAYTSCDHIQPKKRRCVKFSRHEHFTSVTWLDRLHSLKEPPTVLVKAQDQSEAVSIDKDSRKRKNESLAFVESNDSGIARLILAKKPKPFRDGVLGAEKRIDNKETRALMHARAARLQGMDAT